MTFTQKDKMCLSKHRYPDKVTAFLDILRIKKKYSNVACTDLRPYQCPICRGFHLSKTPDKYSYVQKMDLTFTKKGG